ncbi:two-component system sensor histidine kinase NtrB [Granulicella sibirica]|uniref:histidine kinase n=1 Tax=Granulicella sibirica TaxID=2479048 RepID=A0A4Q0SZ92_9BACT|nr:ATP-binding protein [Granulicella sibirica]RXH54541.1 histidine kinase [Granulicella sibirica]
MRPEREHETPDRPREEPIAAELLRLRSEVHTLRHLLEVHEATALTQAARAESALEDLRHAAKARESQALLVHELIEASRDAVLVMDEHWIIRYMNAAAIRTISDGEDLSGRMFLDVYPGVVETTFYPRYQQSMRDRTAITFEDFNSMRQRWYVVNVAPVGPGIAIFFQDITERKKQEVALARTEKLAAVGRLASSISHEINNPLESIVNLLYLIEHSEAAGPDMKTYASLAASELQRVSHIVTQTLKFHRQSTHAQSTRMTEILESVISLFQGRLATLQVKVQRKFASNDSIVCFAGDMRQVFANLFGNALDALRGKGDIHLRTRCTRDWKTGRPGLRVIVADNGCGMSEATQRGLFEAFFTTKPTTGTGLGLWVSLEIIRNHQGWVRVRSSETPGRSGTVFALFFPTRE